MTADDFVYSFRRLVDPATGSDYASYLDDAKVLNAQAIINGNVSPDTLGIKAIDAKTLEIILSEPVPYFVDMMTHWSVLPVHRASVEKFGKKWTDPANIVVNGAYKPSQWAVNEKIVLTKNPSYYDANAVQIESLTLLPIPQATTDVLRYQAGEIDITASELPSEQFDKLKADYGNELKTAPALCTYYFDLNNQKPPFDDLRVRTALALTLDREQIADKVMGQGQIAAYQFIPTAIKGSVNFTPKWQAWSMDQRIAKAKELLNEAGYNEQNPLKFDLLYDTNESHKKIALAATSLWKQAIGFIDVNLTN